MPSTHLSLHYHLVFSTKNRIHKRQTFEEEYLEMLKLAAIDYDPRYVW